MSDDESRPCPACGKPALDGCVTCGQAQCSSEQNWRNVQEGQAARGGATFELALPLDDSSMQKFIRGAEKSGLDCRRCVECTRLMWTRRPESLCPPCAGLVAPDCYRCGSDAHVRRNCPLPELELGMSIEESEARAAKKALAVWLVYVRLSSHRFLVGTVEQLARFGHFDVQRPES